MKFAKILFYVASIWGIVVIAPLYFLFDTIGRQDPPPITHPGFYYGFAGCAFTWQLAFLIIAKDPVRFRPLIIPSVLEKFSFAIAQLVLFLEHRSRGGDLALGGVDAGFAILFCVVYFQTAA
jgi:hypothetical protein